MIDKIKMVKLVVWVLVVAILVFVVFISPLWILLTPICGIAIISVLFQMLFRR